MTDDAIHRLVERTRKASGVPRYVEDPALLGLVADVIIGMDARRGAGQGRRSLALTERASDVRATATDEDLPR